MDLSICEQYDHNLVKLSSFYTNIMDKNMLPHQFINFFDQIWILL
jgi:hypothetical protein